MKRLTTLALGLTFFFTATAFASYDIILENNTPHTLIISTQGDLELPKSAYDGWQNKTLRPFERAKVQRMNYYTHIKSGHDYLFNLFVSLEEQQPPLITFHTTIHGDLTGSHITHTDVKTPLGVVDFFKDKPHPDYVQLKSSTFQPLFSKNEPLSIYQAAVKYSIPNPHINYQSTDMLVLSINAPQPQYNYSESANDLTALSYNVQLWPLYGKAAGMIMNQPEARAKDIPARLKNYDVVAVQELMSHEHRLSFKHSMSETFPFHVGPISDSRPLSSGVMIFSRWPILTQKTYIYDACQGIDCGASKGISYAKINKLGHPYHIFATHVQAGGTRKNPEHSHLSARNKQFFELAHFIAIQHIPKDEPVLLLGDLNTNAVGCPGGKNCARFDFLMETLKAKFTPYKNTNVLPYSSDSSRNWMVKGKHSAGILDYILPLSNYLLPQSQESRILALRGNDDSALYNGNPYGDTDLSDHFAVESHLVY